MIGESSDEINCRLNIIKKKLSKLTNFVVVVLFFCFCFLTNSHLQNITYKTKDRVTQTPLITGDELRCSGRVDSSCSTRDNCRVNLITNSVISHNFFMKLTFFYSCKVNTTKIIFFPLYILEILMLAVKVGYANHVYLFFFYSKIICFLYLIVGKWYQSSKNNRKNNKFEYSL